MNGPVALVVALVSYGNTFLSTGKADHKLDFNNSTLIYNTQLLFKDTILNKTLATDAQQWFSFLKKGGCKKLKLFYRHSNETQLKDFESAAFVGGGGIWQIEAVYDNYSDYWGFDEKVVNEDVKAKRIWSTVFKIAERKQPKSKLLITTEEAKRSLSISLNKIEKFASDHKLDYWADIFRKAQENLNSTEPTPSYYNDCVISNQYPLKKMQLLSAASTADVFGGMGSWNDIVYDTKKEEKENSDLSSSLFDSMNKAIIAAIND